MRITCAARSRDDVARPRAAPLLAACRMGSNHHALGDPAVPSVPTFEAQGCCSSKTSASAGQHGDHGSAKPEAQTAAAEFKGDPYLLDTDPVSGVKLGPIEKQVVVVYAATAGYTDKLPVDSLKQYEADLYRYIDEKHSELWGEIKTKREITDDIKKTLDKALKAFGKKFVASEEE